MENKQEYDSQRKKGLLKQMGQMRLQIEAGDQGLWGKYVGVAIQLAANHSQGNVRECEDAFTSIQKEFLVRFEQGRPQLASSTAPEQLGPFSMDELMQLAQLINKVTIWRIATRNKDSHFDEDFVDNYFRLIQAKYNQITEEYINAESTDVSKFVEVMAVLLRVKATPIQSKLVDQSNMNMLPLIMLCLFRAQELPEKSSVKRARLFASLLHSLNRVQQLQLSLERLPTVYSAKYEHGPALVQLIHERLIDFKHLLPVDEILHTAVNPAFWRMFQGRAVENVNKDEVIEVLWSRINQNEVWQEAKQDTQRLLVCIDATRRLKLNAGPASKANSECDHRLKEAYEQLADGKHSLPPSRIASDLKLIIQGKLHSQKYKQYLYQKGNFTKYIKYLKNRAGFKSGDQAKLSEIMEHCPQELQEEYLQQARAILGAAEAAFPESESRGESQAESAPLVASSLGPLLEIEGANLSQSTKSQLLRILNGCDLSNLNQLAEVAEMLDTHNVSRRGNEDVWDALLNQSLRAKLRPGGPRGYDAGFQAIVLAIAHQSDGDQTAFGHVQQLLEGTSNDILSVEGVLTLRNAILEKYPTKVEVVTALEYRATTMLYEWSRAKNNYVLSTNQNELANSAHMQRLQGKQARQWAHAGAKGSLYRKTMDMAMKLK